MLDDRDESSRTHIVKHALAFFNVAIDKNLLDSLDAIDRLRGHRARELTFA